MFTACYKRFVRDASPAADSRPLIIDPNNVPESEHFVRISRPDYTPSSLGVQSTLAKEQTPCLIRPSVADSASEPQFVFDTTALLQVGKILVGARHLATNAGILALSANVLHGIGYAWAGEIGPLQQYQQTLKTTARWVGQTLRCLESDELILSPDGVLEPVEQEFASAHLSVYSTYSLGVPSSQYSLAVLDELNAWVCEFRVELREALSWLDCFIGRVSHLLTVAFRFVSSPVRFFCSVRWEKRRWFLYHGTRPPRPTVQAIMNLFAVACSRSDPAY